MNIATQNKTTTSIPLSVSHVTNQFCENPGYVDEESFEKWTSKELIHNELIREFVRIRNLITYIYDDIEYYSEDNKSYLHLFHFKFAMLLSIISMKRDYLSKCLPDEKDIDLSVSADSCCQSLTAFNVEEIDYESKFSHVTDLSKVLNLILNTDDSYMINKMIESTSSFCPHVYLPSQIDFPSLNMFLKVNQKKIIVVNYSYFKWSAKYK